MGKDYKAIVLLYSLFMTSLTILFFFSMILLMSLNYLHHDEHTIWGILVLNILVYGSGIFSVDYIILKKAKSKI